MNLRLDIVRQLKELKDVDDRIANGDQCSKRILEGNIFCMKGAVAYFFDELQFPHKGNSSESHDISISRTHRVDVVNGFSAV